MQLTTNTTLTQLFHDIARAAEIIGTPCNEEIVRRVLGVYEDFYCTSSVAFRTTTKAAPELSVRYLDTRPHDPYAMAREAGLIKLDGHPVENLLFEVQECFPIKLYGVDFVTSHGFEKIWPFFYEPLPIEEAMMLPSMPPSLKNHVDHFRRFGIKTFTLMGMDFWNKTTNIYCFPTDRALVEPDKIADMIEDLGFTLPSQEELEISSTCVGLYYTFSWDSPRIERLCFILLGPEEAVPGHLHPMLKRFATEVPLQASQRMFTWNTTYGVRGNYLKIEADYWGKLGDILGYLPGFLDIAVEE